METKHLTTIERSKLLPYLTLARHCLPQQPIEPILSNFLISFDAEESKITITSWDMKAGINIILEGSVQENANICIDGKIFYEIILKLDNADIILGMDNTNLYINQENHSFSVPIVDQSGNYPQLPIPNEEAIGFEIPRNKLALGINSIAYAISTDECKQIITGANLIIKDKKWELASTDAHRLSHISSEEECLDESVELQTTIPLGGLDIIYKAIEEYPFNNMWIFVQRGSVFATLEENITIYSRTLEGDYPQYHSIIPQYADYEFTVERAALNKCLNILNTVGERKAPTIKFDFSHSDNKAIITTNSKTGQGKTAITVKGNLPQSIIAFNTRYLQDAVKACKTDELLFRFNDSLKPVIIEPIGNLTPQLNLIMPVQITDEEPAPNNKANKKEKFTRAEVRSKK
ncbi:MAG: DNA polymerase III subunit beta [Cyanobacteria bacterium J06635_10]